MPTFPRTAGAKPRLITMPKFPEALQTWGRAGRGQFRAVTNMGRVWQEIYPNLRTDTDAFRALMAAINQGLRGGVVWDVQHLYLLANRGIGGGTPLVQGAGQTGSTLNVDGAGNNKTNWLKAGDIIKVTGCAVVFDVTANVNTNGTGQAAIPINPPIFVGQSPADNAAVAIDPSTFYFKAVMAEVSLPEMDVSKIAAAGLSITWREQPL